MRKHPQTSNRRRFGFDLLEGRQLLSGGPYPASMAQPVGVAYGPPAAHGGLEDHDARIGEPGPSGLMYAPTPGGPGSGMDDHGDGADRAAQSPGDATASAPQWGTELMAANTPPSSPAPNSMVFASPAATGDGAAASSSDPASGSAAMLSSAPYGTSTGGASLAAGDAAVPGPSQAMMPSLNLPPPIVPGAFELAARSQDVAPSSGVMISLPASPPDLFTTARGRTEPFEIVGSTTGALSSTGGPNAPGVQALFAQATAPPASTSAAGSVFQAVAGSPSLSLQPAASADSDAPLAGHPASAAGPVLRPAVQAGRMDSPLGRSILAITVSHPGPTTGHAEPPSDRGVASLRPLGADLIAEALPFAGGSLEGSLNDFVRQLQAGDMTGLVKGGPPPAVVASVTVLAAAASALVVREISRRRSARGRGVRMTDHLGRELALSFPELPRSWSERW